MRKHRTKSVTFIYLIDICRPRIMQKASRKRYGYTLGSKTRGNPRGFRVQSLGRATSLFWFFVFVFEMLVMLYSGELAEGQSGLWMTLQKETIWEDHVLF